MAIAGRPSKGGRAEEDGKLLTRLEWPNSWLFVWIFCFVFMCIFPIAVVYVHIAFCCRRVLFLPITRQVLFSPIARRVLLLPIFH